MDRRVPIFHTMGCRLNAYETEAMKELAAQAGVQDAIIVNTCAVTAEAEKQGRQAIRRMRRDNPNARIVVTGCAAQIAPDRYAALPEVDAVLGNAEKMRPESWAAAALDATPLRAAGWGETAASSEAPIVERFEGRTRAHLEVQNGCDHRCTFCVIPFGRGPSRSAPIGAIAARAQALAAAVLHRPAGAVLWRAADAGEAVFLSTIAAGAPIGDAAVAAAEVDADFDPAAAFGRALADGLLDGGFAAP